MTLTRFTLDISVLDPVDRNLLYDTFSLVRSFVSNHIEQAGDSPLPDRDDPFVWRLSGPPGRQYVGFWMQSSYETELKWSDVRDVVIQLKRALPDINRNRLCKFSMISRTGVFLGAGFTSLRETDGNAGVEDVVSGPIPVQNVTLALGAGSGNVAATS